MKASRAYIAGLGTSGVLIASFLLLLAVVSAIVAFRGFPGEASNDGLDRLDAREGATSAKLAASERQTHKGTPSRDRGATRTARGGAGRAGQAGGVGAVEGERIGGGPGAGPGGGGGLDSGNGGGNGSGNGLPALPVSPGGGGLPQAPAVQDVTGGLGGTLEDTTGGLDESIGGAAPNVGDAVTGAGETAGDVVGETGAAVDQAIGGATGGLGDAAGGLVGRGN